MATAPVALIRRKAIIRKFIAHGAVSPETAKTPEEVGSFKSLGLLYSRLESRGVLKSCGDNRYYIDTEGVARDSRRIRRIFLIFLGTFTAVSLAISSMSAEVPLVVIIPGLAFAVILVALGVGLSIRN